MTIVTTNQDLLASWLCKRIGLEPTLHLKCIGNLGLRNQLNAVIGYDGYNKASVVMHVAGEGNWVNRGLLFAVFDYPFRVLDCNMVIGMVPSGNRAAIRFNTHLGFQIENQLHGAHPDGSLYLMTMRRDQCRWLEKRHGKEIVRAAART